MAEKQILIGAKVDSTLKSAAQAVKREMADVGKQIEALNKTMGQGKNSQSPGFGRLIQNQIGDLKKLQKQAGDTYKAIASEAERQAQKEVAHLKRIDQAVTKLTKEYNSLTLAHKALASTPGAEFAAQHADRMRAAKGGQLTRALGLRSERQERLEAHQSIYSTGGGVSPPGGGGGGAAQPPSQPPKSRELSNADIALIGASVGRAIGGALQQAGSFAQGLKNMDVNNLAAASQGSVGKVLNAALSGDVRLGYAAKYLQDASGKGTLGNQLDAQAGGQKAGAAMLIGQGVGSAASLVGHIATIAGTGGAGAGMAAGSAVRTAGNLTSAGGSIPGDIAGIANPIASYAYGGLDVQELQSLNERAENTLAANPFTSAAADLIQQEKHARAAASRRLMGRHLAASGLGAGYGYGREESFGIAGQLQGMTGMQGMFGEQGKLIKKGISSNDAHRAYDMIMSGEVGGGLGGVVGADKVREKLADMQKDKYGPGTRGLLQSSMQIAGHGIDMGVGMGALSSMFGATNSPEKAMQTIERAVSLGTTRGFTDPRAQQEIVQALGQAAQGSTLKGTGGLDTLANLLTGRMSGDTPQVAQMQARVAALGGADRIAANPYFQGKSIASALTNGSTVQQGLLGTASIQDLLKGGQRFDDLGITEAQRNKQARTKLQQELNYAASQSGDPEIMNLLHQSGGSGAFFGDDGTDAGKKRHSVLRRTFARLKEFNTDQGSEAAAKLYENMDDLGSGGANAKKMKQFGDQAAFAAISIEERVKQKLETLVDQLGKYMSNQDEFMKTLEKAQGDEAAGKNYDIQKNKVFLIKVLAEQGELGKAPAPDKKPPG